MSGHNHDHTPQEKKPVSFTTPFILACVTLVFVFGFLSLCNPKQDCCDDKECTEKCEKGKGGECEDKHGHEGKEANSAEASGASETAPAVEAAPAQEAAPAEHGK